jgi:hypothetical protein
VLNLEQEQYNFISKVFSANLKDVAHTESMVNHHQSHTLEVNQNMINTYSNTVGNLSQVSINVLFCIKATLFLPTICHARHVRERIFNAIKEVSII